MSALCARCEWSRGEGKSMRDLVHPAWARVLLAGAAISRVAAWPAMAAETVAPIAAPAALATPPNANNNWRITPPPTLHLSATDDVAVAKLHYTLDGGA